MTITTVLLTAGQVRALLDRAGVTPAAASPLAELPPVTAVSEGGPGWEPLVAHGYVVPAAGGGWRPNGVVLGALAAAARPAEVLSLHAITPGSPALTICRRGDFWTEASVGGGAVKLAFPLNRGVFLLAALSGLSADHPEPRPSGFRFIGAAGEAFVLAALLAAGGDDRGVPTEALLAAVERRLSSPDALAPFAAMPGRDTVTALRDAAARVAALDRLVAAGHVERQGGALRPTSPVRQALGASLDRAFVCSRTVIDDPAGESAGGGLTSDPAVHRRSLTAMRAGERTLLFRTAPGDRVEWSEVSRAELRSLVTAVLLPEADLARVIAEST